jgi:Trk-type K+ transport systems, membrane components
MKHRIHTANTQLFAYFIVLALLGSVLFQIPLLYVSGKPVPYLDGLFTTVSALCVTGLSTVDMSVYNGKGLVLLLFFIEAGGLGLVTFFAMYLAVPSKKISMVNRNFIRDFFVDDTEVNPRQIIVRILLTTFAIQTAGAVLLSVFLNAAGERHSIFYAIFISVSAYCNAGFAPYSDSLHRFSANYGICLTVCALVIAGGLGFTVINDVATKAHRHIRDRRKYIMSFHTHVVFFMTVLLIVVGTVVFFIAEYSHAFAGMSIPRKILNSVFQSVTLRTAGFDTVEQSTFSAPSTIVSVILMMTGGSPGSMAGGLKTTTVFLVCCYAFKNQEDKGDLSVFRRDIPMSVLEKAVGVLVKGFCIFFVSMLLLSFSEHAALQSGVFSLSDLVYEAVSAFGTVGVSKGITSSLSVYGKIVIILTMFAGRTGIIAMTMSAARGGIQKELTDYPYGTILVG